MSPVSHLHFWDTASKKSFGHVSLQIEGGCYISFWPGVEQNSIYQAVGGCQGMWFDSFEEEAEEKGYPSSTLHLTDLNTEKIAEWWGKFTSTKPAWTLLSQSCSNIVYRALCEGSEDFKGCVEGFVTTPSAVAQLVSYHLKKQKAKIRFSACKPCK